MGLEILYLYNKTYPRCGSNSKVSIRAIILIGPLGATSLVLLCKASQPLMEALVVTRKYYTTMKFNHNIKNLSTEYTQVRMYHKIAYLQNKDNNFQA